MLTQPHFMTLLSAYFMSYFTYISSYSVRRLIKHCDPHSPDDVTEVHKVKKFDRSLSGVSDKGNIQVDFTQGCPTFWHLWATLGEELSWATH